MANTMRLRSRRVFTAERAVTVLSVGDHREDPPTLGIIAATVVGEIVIVVVAAEAVIA